MKILLSEIERIFNPINLNYCLRDRVFRICIDRLYIIGNEFNTSVSSKAKTPEEAIEEFCKLISNRKLGNSLLSESYLIQTGEVINDYDFE